MELLWGSNGVLSARFADVIALRPDVFNIVLLYSVEDKWGSFSVFWECVLGLGLKRYWRLLLLDRLLLTFPVEGDFGVWIALM